MTTAVARKRGPRRNLSAFKSAVDKARDFMAKPKDGEAEDPDPAMLVGLYAVLHEKIYGVLPEELADDWYPALSTVTRFVENNKTRFQIVEYVKWVWRRERARRVKNPESDFRVSWRYQFSQKLVTDYRIAAKV